MGCVYDSECDNYVTGGDVQEGKTCLYNQFGGQKPCFSSKSPSQQLFWGAKPLKIFNWGLSPAGTCLECELNS